MTPNESKLIETLLRNNIIAFDKCSQQQAHTNNFLNKVTLSSQALALGMQASLFDEKTVADLSNEFGQGAWGFFNGMDLLTGSPSQGHRRAALTMAECEWLRVNLPKASKGFVTKVTVTTTRTPDHNDKIHTNFFIGTVFNRAKVEELFAGKTWATPDFLTTTREKKKVGVGSLQMLELRTWWAIATNPSDFLLSGRGVIECRSVRPVLGKDYTKQVKNLAKALVSDNFKEALELVVGEEIKFCMGISRDLTIPLSDADFDLMCEGRSKWRLKETDNRASRLPEYELLGPFPTLAFAPTKEDMGERFQVFYVELMADDGHTHFAVVSHPKKNGLQMEKDWNTCVTQANKARCDWSFDDDLVPRMKDKGWSFEGIPTVTLHY
jgi:hypothetical protein